MEIAVVGGGISGLSTAFHIERLAKERGLDVTVRLFESDNRLGGKVDTAEIDGFVIERGVNGWLDSKPSTDALCSSLGIYGQRLVSNEAARKRFIWKNKNLVRLPESPGAFLASGLMSVGGKLRLITEPFAKPPPKDEDESLASFARRRLGNEALEMLLDPMVSGIFAGDPEQMSLKSCFPRIAEIEREYGGLIKGLIKIQKQRRKEKRSAGPAGPGGKLISFAGGTAEIIGSLRDALTGPIDTGKTLSRIDKRSGGYHLCFADDSTCDVDRVVLATPAWATARIIDALDSDLARELEAIPYAAVTVVALAWQHKDLGRDLDGFGFLIPHSQNRGILGTLWDSSMFSNRAPPGFVLTRSMVGGMRRGELALKPDEMIVGSVRAELGEILAVDVEPSLVHLKKHERAIPQYVPGHAKRLERITGRLQSFAGLLLTGNAYHGVGLNDCTAQAVVAADQALAGK